MYGVYNSINIRNIKFVYNSINIRNIKFISYIYILFFSQFYKLLARKTKFEDENHFLQTKEQRKWRRRRPIRWEWTMVYSDVMWRRNEIIEV